MTRQAAVVVALLLGPLGGCSREQAGEPPPTATSAPTPASAGQPASVGPTVERGSATAPEAATAPLFVDVAAESGLDFVHWNGMTGALYFVEPVGSGAALADLDGDGDLDAFLVQGRLLVADSASPPGPPVFPPPQRPGGRLYRNDLRIDASGRRHLRFTDVTEQSGLRADGYGMGVATGDYDGDGRTDLYLTNFGSNQLWRNVGEGGRLAFRDVTAEAGVDDPRWSTSASFADLDADGWLDLFVANYVDFRLATHKLCRSSGGRPDYCGPQSYGGEPARVFRNRGDGSFEDVSGPAGVVGSPSSGLGVVAADFDRDGRLDVYVANDLQANHLWRQTAPFAFENVALVSGCALSAMGRAQASMGVVAGDVDGDGDDDLFMTHLTGDTNTLYLNDGHGVFDDASAASRLGPASFEATGFGTVLVDYDNDGWLDVMAANGAVKVIEAQVRAGEAYPLRQANQLFRNRGDGRFEDVSAGAGPEFARLEVSRGVAVGDVDNDGRSDLLVANNSGPARLLRNLSGAGNAWIGLRLVTRGSRDALGARVRIRRQDGRVLSRRAATDGSYLSANDPRVLAGLGKGGAPDAVEVMWPGGAVEEWRDLPAGRYTTLVEGRGRAVRRQGAP